jgi:biopolymer transport protein ExbD
MSAHRPRPPDDVFFPVVPMLDMAFQILLFFIMIYHPSQLEGQMDLTLPDAAEAKAAAVAEAKPDKSMVGDVELPSEITVIVKTRHDGSHDGAISQITVQETAGTQPLENVEALQKYLREERGKLSNQNDIKIQAESGLKYAAVMKVMDACTKARFTNVSFGPPPDLGGGQ